VFHCLLEVRVEIVDVQPGDMRAGRGVVLQPEHQQRAVAHAELDPGPLVVIVLRQRIDRRQAEGILEPARPGGRLRVVHLDREPREHLWRPVCRGAARAPGAEPRRDRAHPCQAALGLRAGRDRRVDRHPRAAAGHGFEQHLDLHLVDRAAPGKPLAGFPAGDPGQFERVRLVLLQDPPADTGLTRDRDRSGGVEEVDRAAHPPEVHLLGEGAERGVRVGVDLDLRGDVHAQPSIRDTCRWNEASCSSQWA
jgi:hypothetical protein